ncbi:hypothetical protein H8S37_04065 [Mediterraneibacter sp. NSJ-55]|uniref:Uncharacterized protein n=1 Tax=Mediterraneibacter hominis TaxID=2763054 RepID=A0A923RP44_9FIRM|nr:hypothetical protein [Mediterraneibacter hominis]MBC5688109.1 hypothetical protein [Mediterraneibacter hominis]
MGKNKSKKKQVTHYQKMISNMKKLDNYLKAEMLVAKKKKSNNNDKQKEK